MQGQLWFRVAEKSWLEKIVAWRQSSVFSHVELAFPEAKLAGSSTPKTGVRLTTVAELEGSKARWVIVDVPEHIDCSRALDWFEAHKGEPYDVASILDIAVGKPPKDNNAWYCSEACCEALKQCGIWGRVGSRGVTPVVLYYMALALY